jgi:hypothetical protein
LAQAAGRPLPVYRPDLGGGADLDYHIGRVATYPEGNVTNSVLPIGDTWDYLIIQGESLEATARLGDPADFRNDALTLYRAVRDHVSGRGAGVKVILYETFARAPGNTTYYPGFWANPAAMQADVRAGYEAALNHIHAQEGAASASLARVGDAFEAGDFSLDLYYTDLIHQDKLGPAVIAMVLYETIYGAEVADIAYADAVKAGFTSYYVFGRTYTLSEADWNRCVAWVNGTQLPSAATPTATPTFAPTDEPTVIPSAGG